MIADQNFYDICFKFFHPTASATAYGRRPKFVMAEHSATAEGENCAYGPTLQSRQQVLITYCPNRYILCLSPLTKKKRKKDAKHNKKHSCKSWFRVVKLSATYLGPNKLECLIEIWTTVRTLKIVTAWILGQQLEVAQTYCLLLIVSHGSGPFLLAHFWVKHQESYSMLLFCRKVWKLYNSVVHSLCCNPPLIIYRSVIVHTT